MKKNSKKLHKLDNYEIESINKIIKQFNRIILKTKNGIENDGFLIVNSIGGATATAAVANPPPTANDIIGNFNTAFSDLERSVQELIAQCSSMHQSSVNTNTTKQELEKRMKVLQKHLDENLKKNYVLKLISSIFFLKMIFLILILKYTLDFMFQS